MKSVAEIARDPVLASSVHLTIQALAGRSLGIVIVLVEDDGSTAMLNNIHDRKRLEDLLAAAWHKVSTSAANEVVPRLEAS